MNNCTLMLTFLKSNAVLIKLKGVLKKKIVKKGVVKKGVVFYCQKRCCKKKVL